MRRNLVTLLLATLAMSSTIVWAENEAEPPEPLWKGSLGLAYLATSGNTDTQTLGLDFRMERRPVPWGFEVYANFNSAEENETKTSERYLAGGRAIRTLSDRWEYFAGLRFEKDQFAGFDLLSLAETGVTYKALTGPKYLLSFDGGLTFTDEDRIEPEPDVSFVGGIAGLAFEWKISDNSSLIERLIFYPNFDESSDWRLASDTGLQVAMNSRLAVKLGFEIRHRNKPIGDNDSTDTATKVSLVYNL